MIDLKESRPLTTREAVDYLRYQYGMKRTVRTMQWYRSQGIGPEHFKLGRNDTRYTEEALDRWVTLQMLEHSRECAV